MSFRDIDFFKLNGTWFQKGTDFVEKMKMKVLWATWYTNHIFPKIRGYNFIQIMSSKAMDTLKLQNT